MVECVEKNCILWNIEIPLVIPSVTTFSSKLGNRLDEKKKVLKRKKIEKIFLNKKRRMKWLTMLGSSRTSTLARSVWPVLGAYK